MHLWPRRLLTDTWAVRPERKSRIQWRSSVGDTERLQFAHQLGVDHAVEGGGEVVEGGEDAERREVFLAAPRAADVLVVVHNVHDFVELLEQRVRRRAGPPEAELHLVQCDLFQKAFRHDTLGELRHDLCQPYRARRRGSRGSWALVEG